MIASGHIHYASGMQSSRSAMMEKLRSSRAHQLNMPVTDSSCATIISTSGRIQGFTCVISR